MGMRVPFARPWITEHDISAVVASMQSDALTNAGNVRAFEERFVEFCGGGIAHAVTSCMAALHISTMNFITPGKEVIVPALTHPATAMAVTLAGGHCVFVDVSRETGNMEPEVIEAAITKNTCAVMVLHYLGRPADMPAIMVVAKKHDLRIIEDCALAPGARIDGRHVGLWGDAGCFSFYPAKHITTFEGGMILTKDPKFGERALRMRHFGQRHYRDLGLLKAAPDWVEVGLNYRMTEPQGAVGCIQMQRMQKILNERKKNYITLSGKLPDLEQIQSRAVGSVGCAYYGLSVFVPDRDEVKAELKRRDIEASVYYQTPVPHIGVYAEGHKRGQFPNAEAICGETICLPVGPHMTREAIDYVASTLKEIV